MYKKMLVPLDGSELAEGVMPFVTELATELELEIVVLNICPNQQRKFIWAHREYARRAVAGLKQTLSEAQAKKCAPPEGTTVKVRGQVLIGDPAEKILQYADRNEIDLILMATHGESGVSQWHMGGVVDKVLATSKVPVFLVRAGVSDEVFYDRWPKRTILVPLDGSELAESVLPHVEALAKQRGTIPVEVVLLSVYETLPIPSFYPSGACLEDDEDCFRRRVEMEEYLDGIADRLKAAGLNMRSLVLEGKPADAIIDYATENRFNIIVMTTHGSSGVQKWRYGSVAGKVLLGAPSPIVLVRVSLTELKA